jgi:hypothetical protein
MRGKEACNDIMQFDVEPNIVQTVQTTSHVASSTNPSTSTVDSINNCEKPSGVCYATIDLKKAEMYVLMKNNLWVYSLATNEFYTINSQAQPNSSGSTSSATPSPTSSSSSYKILTESHTRGDINYFVLSDTELLHVFKTNCEYSIQLQKPSREHVLNYCKYLIRRQQYEEITKNNPISALEFLRNNLSETIDKNDINQVNDFHKLASLLFCNNHKQQKQTNAAYADNAGDDDDEDDRNETGGDTNGHNKTRIQRSILFNKLTSLLPQKICQPQQSLLNFINM